MAPGARFAVNALGLERACKSGSLLLALAAPSNAAEGIGPPGRPGTEETKPSARRQRANSEPEGVLATATSAAPSCSACRAA